MISKQIAGFSVLNLPIELYQISIPANKKKIPILFIGGVHGNESEGFLFLETLLDTIKKKQISIPEEVDLWICPRINPDGCKVLRRTNHRNVDLNRNLPTKDWSYQFSDPKYYPGPFPASEPETKATLVMIHNIQPRFIISFHSYEKPMINYNGDCLELAKEMSKYNHLEPKGDIGYPTPGSLGTFAGLEQKIPTITLEILRGQSPEEVWKQHLDSVLSAINFYI